MIFKICSIFTQHENDPHSVYHLLYAKSVHFYQQQLEFLNTPKYLLRKQTYSFATMYSKSLTREILVSYIKTFTLHTARLKRKTRGNEGSITFLIILNHPDSFLRLENQ